MKKRITALFISIVITAVLFQAAVFSASADSFSLGDVDLNSSIDSCDALLTMRASVALAELDTNQMILADVNLDNVVNTSDSLAILQKAIGIGSFEAVVSIDFSSKRSSLSKNISSYEDEIVRLCNEARKANGLSPLEKDDSLFGVSDIRAAELKYTCNHIRPDGNLWSSVLGDSGISFLTCGENVAGGFDNPQDVFDAWMASEGHRSNILNPEYTSIGVGYCFIEDSRYGHYWEQIFIKQSQQLEDEQASVDELLSLINAERSKNGLPALATDLSATAVADIRADDISADFSTNRPGGGAWSDLLDEYDVSYTAASQLICEGQQNGREVFDYYMTKYRKEGALPKFLDGSKGYTRIGIGHNFVEDDDYAHHWTLILVK